MKKIFVSLIVVTAFSFTAFAQDSARMKSPAEKSWPAPTDKRYKASDSTGPKLYRPSRLGSSQKKYDTYKKNDYGAGAITTQPKKVN